MLYGFDLKRKKRWHCKPSEVGQRRDFYRVEDPALADPLVIEKIFSKIESTFCATSRILDSKKRGPANGQELGILTEYMTIQATRTPAFRKLVDRMVMSETSSWLESPQKWEEALRIAGIQSDSEGADYESMKNFEASGRMKIEAQPGFYLKSSALAVEQIGASLERRYWNAHVSLTGQFIGSDSPVTLDSSKDQPVNIPRQSRISANLFVAMAS
jgi:hypothetical protein